MAVSPENKRLNLKEIIFASLVLRGVDQKEAFIEAGFSPTRADSAVVRLMNKPHIIKYLDEETKRMRDVVKRELDIDELWVTEQFKKVYERSTAGGMPIMKVVEDGSAEMARDENGNVLCQINDTVGAIKALENIAKHVGYYEADNKQKQTVINVMTQTNVVNFFESDESERTAED